MAWGIGLHLWFVLLGVGQVILLLAYLLSFFNQTSRRKFNMPNMNLTFMSENKMTTCGGALFFTS